MAAWKTLVFALLATISAQGFADEKKGTYEGVMLLITILPFTPFTATTGLSEMAKDNFKPAKDDALTFIGSGGKIRGAQFEQAVRYYHAAYDPAPMTDDQLALAIVTTF